MEEQLDLNFDRIARAITYIGENFKKQPALDEVAEKVHLSPYHFQRLFTEWAGVSPKKFLQYISVEHAKKVLQQQAGISKVAYETGLSGTSRLHDLFVNIERMTPGEYKNGGTGIEISYSHADTPFGQILVAATRKGVCHIGFDDADGLSDLKGRFPQAQISEKSSHFQEDVVRLFTREWHDFESVKLHLRGSDFQLKVWEALLKIPSGQLTTYGNIARSIGKPNASRAVGTAIGSNPIAFLIPCHRVIQSSGHFGGYRWGTPRKTAMIGWEASKALAISTEA